MKGYVLCTAVLAGCWWGSKQPAPEPPVYSAPVHPADEPEPDTRDPFARADPMPDPGSTDPPCYHYDASNPTCRKACRKLGLDDTCGKCPDPPDPDNSFCQQVMPCPTIPDRRIVACRALLVAQPSVPQPLRGRVLNVAINGGATIVTISRGAAAGVAKNWTVVLCDPGGATVPAGKVTVIRVDQRVTIGQLDLNPDAIHEHPIVCFTPP